MLGVEWGTQKESGYNCLESLLERTYSIASLKIMSVMLKLSGRAYLTFDDQEDRLFNLEFKIRRHHYCLGSCLK